MMDRTGRPGKRAVIVTFRREMDRLGNVLNFYGDRLYDSEKDPHQVDQTVRPAALRLLHKAELLFLEHGPVAVGSIEADGTFVPVAYLDRRLIEPGSKTAQIAPRPQSLAIIS